MQSKKFTSAKIQEELASRYIDSSHKSPTRAGLFDSVFQSEVEVIKNRVASQRSPFTGVTKKIQQLESKKADYLSKVTEKMLKNTQRLNSSVLEAWINNTIVDAEHLEVPGCILKPEHRMPLDRYGVDRTSLMTAGIPSSEVDRIYRSLFVYSIGFYQMILRVLEHSSHKYSIVAGLWKVFAILLEYCCHLDYQMIITTLNMEKQGEIQELESYYKDRISELELKEKDVLSKVEETRTQIVSLQKDLRREILKREELEEELVHKGTGHEDEVNMRLQFESKLNHMFAKQRDMNIKITQLLDTINVQQELLTEKSLEINKKSKKIIELKQNTIELQQETKRLEDRLRVFENLQDTYEKNIDILNQKLENSYVKISELNLKINEKMNDNSQMTVRIDDLKCQVEIYRKQFENSEAALKELKIEKDFNAKRVIELETAFFSDINKNTLNEQNLAMLKESDKHKTEELEYLHTTLFTIKQELLSSEKNKNSLEIHLKSSLEVCESLRSSLKATQEHVEEMNRARRITDEQNQILITKLQNRDEEITRLNEKITYNKELLDKEIEEKAKIMSENSEIGHQLKSTKDVFEAQKEALNDKIKSFQNIIESEKVVRQNWIYKYEEEQKTHNMTVRMLTHTQNTLNDSQAKVNSLNSDLEDYKSKADRLTEKTQVQLKELLELRANYDEALRKLKTYQMLLQTIDDEHKERIDEMNEDFKILNDEIQSLRNNSQMQLNDVWSRAHSNLLLVIKRNKKYFKLERLHNHALHNIEHAEFTIREKNEVIENYQMKLEEIRFHIAGLEHRINYFDSHTAELREKYNLVSSELENFKLMIPNHLKLERNPFKPLLDKISRCEQELQVIYDTRNSMVSLEIQTECTCQDSEIQTDEVERIDQDCQTEEKYDDSQSVSKSSKQDSSTEFPLRQKIGNDKGVRIDSRFSNEDEIVQLKSVYNSQSREQKIGKSAERFPDIYRNVSNRKTPTRPSIESSFLQGPSPKIKRSIKQAISRRKHDVDFI